MRLTAQIEEYEMDQVILYIGLDVNILLKKTWDRWVGLLYNEHLSS